MVHLQGLTDTTERSQDFILMGESGQRLLCIETELYRCISHRLLGFRLAPPVVGRKINLTALRPLTSQKLLDTYLEEGLFF